jgi:hypothetical protein
MLPLMPTCFVVMGFGKKTDYRSGRVLDLDKSYKNIIKPAVTSAGYECVRADEIPHSGNINVPMYEQLLGADVVVADVSTYNENAFYELGVRHALKPYTTITIAEDKLVFPFDIGQIAVRQYHHLGEDIGFDEAMRMQSVLKEAVTIVGQKGAIDSPVYTFLNRLQPPVLAKEEIKRAAQAVAEQAPSAPAVDQPTVRALMDQVDACFKRSDFATAKSLLTVVRSMMPTDVFVIQKLALATYKSKQPTVIDALNEAWAMLEALNPANSTDTETLGLYGAVRKRLWEETKQTSHLDKAIWALAKGFYVRNDYYNGINLAYMLNTRASLLPDDAPVATVAEAVADFVLAQRTRRRVIELCEDLLQSKNAPAGESVFWIKATMSQAYAGIGDDAKANELLEEAKKLDLAVPVPTPEGQPTPPPPVPMPVPQWMIDSTVEQLDKLRELLKKSPLNRIAAK